MRRHAAPPCATRPLGGHHPPRAVDHEASALERERERRRRDEEGRRREAEQQYQRMLSAWERRERCGAARGGAIRVLVHVPARSSLRAVQDWGGSRCQCACACRAAPLHVGASLLASARLSPRHGLCDSGSRTAVWWHTPAASRPSRCARHKGRRPRGRRVSCAALIPLPTSSPPFHAHIPTRPEGTLSGSGTGRRTGSATRSASASGTSRCVCVCWGGGRLSRLPAHAPRPCPAGAAGEQRPAGAQRQRPGCL